MKPPTWLEKCGAITTENQGGTPLDRLSMRVAPTAGPGTQHSSYSVHGVVTIVTSSVHQGCAAGGYISSLIALGLFLHPGNSVRISLQSATGTRPLLPHGSSAVVRFSIAQALAQGQRQSYLLYLLCGQERRESTANRIKQRNRRVLRCCTTAVVHLEEAAAAAAVHSSREEE